MCKECGGLFHVDAGGALRLATDEPSVILTLLWPEPQRAHAVSLLKAGGYRLAGPADGRLADVYEKLCPTCAFPIVKHTVPCIVVTQREEHSLAIEEAAIDLEAATGYDREHWRECIAHRLNTLSSE